MRNSCAFRGAIMSLANVIEVLVMAAVLVFAIRFFRKRT